MKTRGNESVKIYTATCITSKFGNFINGKSYKVYYKDSFACSGLPASPYILDEDGDQMIFGWIKKHPNFFDISYVSEEFNKNKDYTHWGDINEKNS